MFTKINKIKNDIINEENLKFILQGGAFNFIAKFLIVFVGLAVNFIIAKFYGSSTMGIYSVIESILNILILISFLGTNSYILKLIPEHNGGSNPRIASRIYKIIFRIGFALSCLFALFMFIFSKQLSKVFFNDKSLFLLLAICALVLIIFTIYELNKETIRAMGQIKYFNILFVLPNTFNFILLLTVTFLFSNIEFAPIYARYTAIILSGIISISLIRKFLSPENKKDDFQIKKQVNISGSEIIKQSFPIFITSLMTSLTSNAGIIIMGLMLNSSEVGIYNIAFKLGTILNFSLLAINSALAPKISELYHSGKGNDLANLMQKSSIITFSISFILSLPLVVFGKDILLFFGKEFSAGYYVLIFIIIGQLVNVFANTIDSFLIMTGNQKSYMNIVIVSGVFNIILNIILIRQFNIYGAAIANMATIILVNIMAMFFIRYKYGYFISYIPFINKL